MPPGISSPTSPSQFTTDLVFQDAARRNKSEDAAVSVKYGTTSLTKTKETSAKKLVQPAESWYQRTKKKVLTQLGRNPAPVPAPAPAPAVAFAAVILPTFGTNLENWNALTDIDLPTSYSATEIEHRSYDLFKKNIVAAVAREEKDGKALGSLPELLEADRKEMSKTFFADLKGSIGPALDARYKAYREKFSLTMPAVLMLAFESAFEEALETAGAKCADASFAQAASKLTFIIKENDPEDVPTYLTSNKLPLQFSLAIKADKSILAVKNAADAAIQLPQDALENALPQIANDISTMAIWNRPFSSAKLFEDKQLSSDRPLETAQEIAIEGYAEVDESEWVASVPAASVATAAASDSIADEPGPDNLISKEDKSGETYMKVLDALGVRENVPVRENNKYRSVAAAVMPESPALAEPEKAVENLPAESMRSGELPFFSFRRKYKQPSGNTEWYVNANPVKPATKSPTPSAAPDSQIESSGEESGYESDGAENKAASLSKSSAPVSQSTTTSRAEKNEKLFKEIFKNGNFKTKKAIDRQRWHDPMGESQKPPVAPKKSLAAKFMKFFKMSKPEPEPKPKFSKDDISAPSKFTHLNSRMPSKSIPVEVKPIQPEPQVDGLFIDREGRYFEQTRF